MTAIDRRLEDLADAYLDGDLPRDEALAFERDLAARPDLAAALASAVALRELLAGLPPVAPPAGLTARIAGALSPQLLSPAPDRAPSTDPSPSAAHAWVAAFSQTLRAPAVAAMGAASPAAPATSGIASVRWALGPLGAPAPRSPPRRPLWQRVLLGRRKA